MIVDMWKISSLVLIPFLLGTQTAAAPQRGPATDAEKTRSLELVQLLEDEPWSDEAPAAREWLWKFIVEVPGLVVKRCFSLLGTQREREGIPDELLIQSTFSSLAFQLRNPQQRAGSTATFMAGVEGTLRSYRALLSHGAIEPIDRLDQLERLRTSGGLEPYIMRRGRFCR